MKYFVLTGLLPCAFEDHMSVGHKSEKRSITARKKSYEREGVKPLKGGEHPLVSVKGYGRISKFVYDLDEALVLIAARSQNRAYLLAHAFTGALSLIGVGVPEDDGWELWELAAQPTEDMTTHKIARCCKVPSWYEGDVAFRYIGLRNGTVLGDHQMRVASSIVPKAIQSPGLLHGLLHLQFSYGLVYGFMVGSYYASHYCRERRSIPRYILDKQYHENRIKFELAFLSTFRGIEAVLGKNGIRENDIHRLLVKFDHRHGTSFSSAKYTSWYETFSGGKKKMPYCKKIAEFLKLRNITAAHANLNSPSMIKQDQVLEAEYLLSEFLCSGLIQERE